MCLDLCLARRKSTAALSAMVQKDPQAFLQEKEQEYQQKFANPYDAASKSYIDGVILPEDTRAYLIKTLEQLENKKSDLPAKKHGNIPL